MGTNKKGKTEGKNREYGKRRKEEKIHPSSPGGPHNEVEHSREKEELLSLERSFSYNNEIIEFGI
jgi:hypothetical protein